MKIYALCSRRNIEDTTHVINATQTCGSRSSRPHLSTIRYHHESRAHMASDPLGLVGTHLLTSQIRGSCCPNCVGVSITVRITCPPTLMREPSVASMPQRGEIRWQGFNVCTLFLRHLGVRVCEGEEKMVVPLVSRLLF